MWSDVFYFGKSAVQQLMLIYQKIDKRTLLLVIHCQLSVSLCDLAINKNILTESDVN